jgi:hypothetical protein
MKTDPKVIEMLQVMPIYSLLRLCGRYPAFYRFEAIIRRLQKQVKRKTKANGQIPPVDSAKKVLVRLFEEYNSKQGEKMH